MILGPILALIGGLRLGLTTGMFCIMCGLLSGGLLDGFTDKIKVDKASPNQGIKLSLRSSSIIFLVTSLSIALIGLIGGLFVPYIDLVQVLGLALFVGLYVGLSRGGSAVIKHYALRLILSLKEHTPLNFVNFLDQCARLTFLKKVGGGYIFIHRMLLDYFADLNPQSTKGGDETRVRPDLRD